jgi:hypothetical protein
MFRRTAVCVGLAIWAACLVLACGGCAATWPAHVPFKTCDELPLQGSLAPACWTRKPCLPCYGYHATCWTPWPPQCGRVCPGAGEVPFLEQGAGARPEGEPTVAPPREAAPREAVPKAAGPGSAVPKPEEP